MHPEVVIRDTKGNVVWSKVLEVDPEEKGGTVAYSANVIGRGRLAYGHFGTFQDLDLLSKVGGQDLIRGNVVLLRISQQHHVASMVRNAEAFGAQAVILFPDVSLLNMTRKYNLFL